jgi:hypothetical protein
MADLKVTGRMKVKSLKTVFNKEFGLTLRLYDGKYFADDNATLASIRQGDNKGGDFSIKANTKIGNFEKKLLKEFGIKSQVADSDDSYLCKDELTLAAAKKADEKRKQKKAKNAGADGANEAGTNTPSMDDNIIDKGEDMGDQETIEFEMTGAYDINIEHQDYSIEELKENNLSELYDQFVEAEERQGYYYHDEDFQDINIMADGSECQFSINKNKLELEEDQIRIISFYYYDETEYMPCEMTHPEGKDYEIMMNIKQLCDGVEYVDSIKLAEGHNEELDDDEIFFELDYSDPGDEDAAMIKIYICNNSGVVAKITDVEEESSRELFIKTINKLS